MAYGLGNIGAAWLKRDLSLPYHKLDWKRKNHVGRVFLEHALLVSEITVAVELACRNRKDIRLLTADNLNIPKMREPFQWKVNIGIKCSVIPDHVFGLEFNGERCWYFLEADRATMPVTRGNLNQTSFYRKLLAYGRLRETWERSVEELLLNDSVRRFRRSVETNRLAKLSDIKSEDIEFVEAAMTKCSKYLRGHDKAVAINEPVPAPAELKTDIENLENWVSGMRKRR